MNGGGRGRQTEKRGGNKKKGKESFRVQESIKQKGSESQDPAKSFRGSVGGRDEDEGGSVGGELRGADLGGIL